MQENAAKKKKDKTTLLMTDGNIWKLLIVFSIPLILGNLLQQMYNTADSIIVGNFVGSNGLAAVGAGTSCFDENPERGFKIIVTLSSNLLRRSYF